MIHKTCRIAEKTINIVVLYAYKPLHLDILNAANVV